MKTKTMKRWIPVLLILLPLLAFANEGGHEAVAHDAHESHGIPSVVWYQVLNFGLYVALLVFFLRKHVVKFFREREASFKQALVKAEQAKHEAEKKRGEIHQRLTHLETSTEESLAKARAEAEALKAKIIAEAEELSAKMKEEAKRTAELEIERAKTHLREELLAQATEMSKKMLVEKMAEQDQKRLQTEFIDKIQVVR
jgi:F-type H+-transporting ATPase subunit b